MILRVLKVDSGFGDKTNCYIVQDEISKEAMVIDPGGEVYKIIEELNQLNADLKYIYLTHCHGDHVKDVVPLKEQKGGKVLIYKDEKENLNNLHINLREYIGIEKEYIEVDLCVNDGDIIYIGSIAFKVIHTPGHTEGGSCLYIEKEGILFSGDTMFKGTHGRIDLPTGNLDDIINSINKLLTLPDETIVYPGHGMSTKIEDEKILI